MIATRHMNLFTFKLFNNKYNKSSIALVVFQVLNKPPAAGGRHVGKCRVKTFLHCRKFYWTESSLLSIKLISSMVQLEEEGINT